MSITKANVKVKTSADLLSYVINQTPILREEIDLPVQGQSIAPIGKIIMSNERYKNAFLNTINIIGLTVITKNHWENPWQEFTKKGQLSYGQTVREIITDIANVYDYNEMVAKESNFIKTEVPNVFEYLHELNYQKYYKTSTSDEQMAMAFERNDLFSLIDEIVNSLYEAYEYDSYLVDKYMLQRRILDGTVTAVQITNFSTKTNREIVSDIKAVSNKMTFKSPNYNPAGIRKATSFDNQFAIISTDFDAKFTTDVLATSYFRSDAELKANMELVDGFGNIDSDRLAEIFAKRDENGNVVAGQYVGGYTPLTTDELNALAEIPAVIVGRDFFQDYDYAFDNSAPTRATEFFNPQTLKTNHWLHYWGVKSTSPFENAVVFSQTAQNVSSITVSPSTATVSKGQKLQLSAVVATTGFANKAVLWTASRSDVSIKQDGTLEIPSDYVVSAGVQGVYVLTISTALASGEELVVDGVTYTPEESDTTASAQATALKTLLEADTGINAKYTIARNSGALTFTEKSGYYGVGKPSVDDSDLTTGVVAETVTTQGKETTNSVVVTATSIYKNSVSGTATITITN